MQRQPSADIIPFPRKEPDRLRRALADLEASLAEQRAAIAAWRASLLELREAMGQLHGSFTDYQTTLSNVAVDVDLLNAESRRLETWADGVLASELH